MDNTPKYTPVHIPPMAKPKIRSRYSEQLRRVGWCLFKAFLWLGGFSIVTAIVLIMIFFVPGSGIYVTIAVIALAVLICFCAYKRPRLPCWKRKRQKDENNQDVITAAETVDLEEGHDQNVDSGISNLNEKKIPTQNLLSSTAVVNPNIRPAVYNSDTGDPANKYSNPNNQPFYNGIEQFDSHGGHYYRNTETVDDVPIEEETQDIDDVLGALCYVAI